MSSFYLCEVNSELVLVRLYELIPVATLVGKDCSWLILKKEKPL